MSSQQVIVDNSSEFDDQLLSAFENEKEFQKLLMNGTFDDYFNTFLSLPVFAKRLLYRRETGLFEIEPPVKRSTHHLLHEKVMCWTRVNRGHTFLKTSICNEYRLSMALLQLPVCLQFDPLSEKELLLYQRKYLGKVIDIQRLKRYLQGSIGENLIQFWLEAERFRRQVQSNCRRFVLKEMQEKYLRHGSPMEISISIRDDVNSYLKRETELCNKNVEAFATILVEPQNMVLHCLQDYWIPKYILHRLRRRTIVTSRWGKAWHNKDMLLRNEKDNVNKKDDENKEKKNLFNVFKEMQTRMQDVNVDSGLNAENNDESETETESEESTTAKCSSTETSEQNVFSATSSEDETLPQTLNNAKTRRIAEGVSRGKKQKDLEMGIKKLKIRDPNKKRSKKKKRSPTQYSSSQTSGTDESSHLSPPPKPKKMYGMSVNIRGTYSNEELLGKYKKEIQHYNQVEKELPKQIILPPLLELFAIEQQKNSRKTTTLFEALYQEKENEYEADTEEDMMNKNNNLKNPKSSESDSKGLRLPLINSLDSTNPSFIATMVRVDSANGQVHIPYTDSFIKKNILAITQEKGKEFHLLMAALTTDSIAGQPLLEFFQKTKNKFAEDNLKFWTAGYKILSNTQCDEPLIRRKQYRILIDLYLSSEQQNYVALPSSAKYELCQLLERDMGLTRLMEACDIVAQTLIPYWEDYLFKDEEDFLKQTTKCKRNFINQDRRGSGFLPNLDLDLNGQFDTSFDDDFFDKKNNSYTATRMWRAMELAMSICLPNQNSLKDANENGNWSTDDDDDDRDEGIGSLGMQRQLHIMNKKAIKTHEVKDSLFNRIGLVHDYSGTAGIFSRLPEMDPTEFMDNIAIHEEQKQKQIARPPRPRCFHDIFNDPLQLDFFKKFLMKEKEETPLLFWVAVESMRTTSKTAKARQGRAHGIVKRYFGIGCNYGKDLKCSADIIREIAALDKVSPAMLVSAQTCVAKSIEDQWFGPYLQTFHDDGGVTGITLLPIYGVGETTVRTVKQKSRGLWRMFTRNVISFRRGIMNTETLYMFRDFLILQHKIHTAEAQNSRRGSADGGIIIPSAGPTRIVVNNKLIFTEKLVADLHFWSEVERYKDFADAIVWCARLGNYTKDDEVIVVKKACTIVDCFIDSQVPPRVQINITTELAENIINLVQNGIVERGLFHEAALSTFSTLIYFWKKFCLYRMLPKETIPVKGKGNLRSDRSVQIALKQKAIAGYKMKKVSLPADEDYPKIMFSLQHGIRIALSRQKKNRDKTSISIGTPQPPTILALSTTQAIFSNQVFQRKKRMGLGNISESSPFKPASFSP